jgi:hypothetical protein
VTSQEKELGHGGMAGLCAKCGGTNVRTIIAAAVFVLVCWAGFVDFPGFEVAYVVAGHKAFRKQMNRERGEAGHVPRVLHQTWKTADIPERFSELVSSWTRFNPDLKRRLWTDADIRGMIADNYSWFLPTFDAYPHPIQR